MAIAASSLVGVELIGVWLMGKSISPFVAGSFPAFELLHFVFFHLLRTPTLAGRRVRDQIEGFRLFLNEVDGDRLNRLIPAGQLPHRFEKYLSYALALDVEQNWARKFSVDLTNATLGMPSPLASDLSNHRTDVEESYTAVPVSWALQKSGFALLFYRELPAGARSRCSWHASQKRRSDECSSKILRNLASPNRTTGSLGVIHF